jgi:hypothetical protein
MTKRRPPLCAFVAYLLLGIMTSAAMLSPSPVNAQTSQPSKAEAKKAKAGPKKPRGSAKKKAAASQPASAERTLPHIAYVFPAGGQRGTTVEIAMGGQGFVDVESIRISGDGVEASVAKTVDDKKLNLSVTIADDASPGERDLRIVTPGGASNRVRFIVSQVPETNEVEPNSQKTRAQLLPSLPVVINGQIFGGDIDCYRFPAKAGQVLVLRVEARALLPFIADAVPGWMQAVLTLYDSSGRQLAYVDDFRLDPDPVLIFTVPRDGEYLAEIKDSLFRGRDDFVYRLSIGELPFITYAYPLGARCGTTTQTELQGANLPDQVVSVDLSSDCPPRRPMSVAAGGLTSNVWPLATGQLEEVSESEPNDSLTGADKAKVPVTVNGRVDHPGDQDIFVFRAPAGQEFVIDVYARRLASPLDSAIVILNSKGAVLARNDDTVDPAEPMITHHADSRLVWKCPATGDYAVRVSDTQGKGGKEFAYRLTIAPPRPDFAVRILPDNPRIAPGDTAVLTAEAVRKDGFDGEVRLSVTGLSDDWSVSAATIPPRETQVRFTLTAPADAVPGLMSPTIKGAASIADNEVVREAWPAEEVMQAFGYQHRLATREFLLAVVEGGFFTLSVELPSGGVVEIPQLGETTVVLKASRVEGGHGPIRLAADGPPKGVTAKAVMIPVGQEEATMTLAALPAASIGMAQNLIITGTMKVGKGSVTRVAPAIPIKIVTGATTTSLEEPASSTTLPSTMPGPEKETK